MSSSSHLRGTPDTGLDRARTPEDARLQREPSDAQGTRLAGEEERRAARESQDLVPYLRYGVPAGLLGAVVVALFFFLLDLVAGRPLATPNALGAALFLDRPFDVSAPLSPALITGFTAVHGAVFIAMASIAAVLILAARRLPEGGTLFFVMTALLFAACEGVFFGLTLLADLSVWSELGFGRVAVANLLASAGMAALLIRGVKAHRRRLDEVGDLGEA
jgi:hypothetical protein